MPENGFAAGKMDLTNSHCLDCLHFTITPWPTAATLPLLLIQTSKLGFTIKEEL
jgi:hypothetical protein